MENTWEQIFDSFCPPYEPLDLYLSSDGMDSEPSAPPSVGSGTPSRRASNSSSTHANSSSIPLADDTVILAVVGPTGPDFGVIRPRQPPAPRPRHAALPPLAARRPIINGPRAEPAATETPVQSLGAASAIPPATEAGRDTTDPPPPTPRTPATSRHPPDPLQAGRPSTPAGGPPPIFRARRRPISDQGIFAFGQTDYVDFHYFITHPTVEAAWRELHDDWLWDWFADTGRRIGRDGPDETAIFWRVKMCEVEPRRWCYNNWEPDKRPWLADAHHARFSVRVQVVRRWMEGLDSGPLSDGVRMRHVQADLRLALFLLKMESARAMRREVEVEELEVEEVEVEEVEV